MPLSRNRKLHPGYVCLLLGKSHYTMNWDFNNEIIIRKGANMMLIVGKTYNI